MNDSHELKQSQKARFKLICGKILCRVPIEATDDVRVSVLSGDCCRFFARHTILLVDAVEIDEDCR
jgi:hypothetical protein